MKDSGLLRLRARFEAFKERGLRVVFGLGFRVRQGQARWCSTNEVPTAALGVSFAYAVGRMLGAAALPLDLKQTRHFPKTNATSRLTSLLKAGLGLEAVWVFTGALQEASRAWRGSKQEYPGFGLVHLVRCLWCSAVLKPGPELDWRRAGPRSRRYGKMPQEPQNPLTPRRRYVCIMNRFGSSQTGGLGDVDWSIVPGQLLNVM